MPEIRQLPTSVINKIAAGEVVERPASVVKELLENSVDAGATRVDVLLEQGGMQLIRVADNGCGMRAEQLPLAIASHATSKIQDADDLFSVRTLGFRGEALASIAEISHFVLRSRTGESDAGAELEVMGGVSQPVSPCGCPVGTAIEVRNLFFNTPVRRKFIRTTQTETGHAVEAFLRIALAHPQVHFTFRHNDRLLYELPPVDNWRERILACFRDEFDQGLIWIDNSDSDVRLSGFVGDPSLNRANNRLQYVFLNGRCIRDKSLQHALGEAYRGLLMVGRFPVAFLRLEMPPSVVDVNVHPTKLEVRFQDSGRLYSQLLSTLRQKFLSTDLTARVNSPSPAAASVVAEPIEEAQRRDLAAWALGVAAGRDVGPTSPGSSPPLSPAAAMNADPAAFPRDLRLDFGRSSSQPFRPFPDSWSATQRIAGSSPATGLAAADTPQSPLATAPAAVVVHEPSVTYAPERVSSSVPSGRGMQVQNRYLVTESEEGMVIIDQHALHERILYEQLRTKVLDGALETQRLLVPEPVHLTPAESAVVLDARDVLSELGIEISPFGGDTVLVMSYPAMLASLNPGELLRQIVNQLLAGGKRPERRDMLDELLHMVACKAAIKAGDKLSLEEVTALLEQRHLCQDAHHCPHGRPTALVFTRDELDRRFKRT